MPAKRKVNPKNVKHTGEHELTHSMVHYLLTIHKLKENQGYARGTDIARELGLTKGSVSTALTLLKKRQLVVEDTSRFLSLSPFGHEQVHHILSSRTLLFYFLKDFVGVNLEVARHDACLMEHLVSDETREKLFVFMKELTEMNSLKKPRFKITLDLTRFKDSHAFEEEQKGDSVLGGVL